MDLLPPCRVERDGDVFAGQQFLYTERGCTRVFNHRHRPLSNSSYSIYRHTQAVLSRVLSLMLRMWWENSLHDIMVMWFCYTDDLRKRDQQETRTWDPDT
jgi:hypothetical protein